MQGGDDDDNVDVIVPDDDDIQLVSSIPGRELIEVFLSLVASVL